MKRAGWSSRPSRPVPILAISTPISCCGWSCCSTTDLPAVPATSRGFTTWETVRERAAEVLDRAPAILARHGFDARPLAPFGQRLASGRLPADDFIEWFEEERSIPALLRRLAELDSAENLEILHS